MPTAVKCAVCGKTQNKRSNAKRFTCCAIVQVIDKSTTVTVGYARPKPLLETITDGAMAGLKKTKLVPKVPGGDVTKSGGDVGSSVNPLPPGAGTTDDENPAEEPKEKIFKIRWDDEKKE